MFTTMPYIVLSFFDFAGKTTIRGYLYHIFVHNEYPAFLQTLNDIKLTVYKQENSQNVHNLKSNF